MNQVDDGFNQKGYCELTIYLIDLITDADSRFESKIIDLNLNC